MNKHHHGAQFSIPVSVLHLGNSACSCTWASLHCCQNITFSTPLFFTFNIHLWEVICLPQNFVYGFKCFVMWNSAGLVMSQPQPLTKAVYRQELDQITTVLAQFTSVYLDSCVKTYYSFLDMFYSKWHVQYTPAIWPLHCGMFSVMIVIDSKKVKQSHYRPGVAQRLPGS